MRFFKVVPPQAKTYLYCWWIRRLTLLIGHTATESRRSLRFCNPVLPENTKPSTSYLSKRMQKNAQSKRHHIFTTGLKAKISWQTCVERHPATRTLRPTQLHHFAVLLARDPLPSPRASSRELVPENLCIITCCIRIFATSQKVGIHLSSKSKNGDLKAEYLTDDSRPQGISHRSPGISTRRCTASEIMTFYAKPHKR